MTDHRDFKRIIRDRQRKTGESYTAARAHVVRERDAMLGVDSPSAAAEPVRAEAVVLKVNARSVRARVLGEETQVTFRFSDLLTVVPGHLVTLVFDKRWTWKGHAYASGSIERARIQVRALGLEPLPLDGGELVDLRHGREPFQNPDPYAPLWRRLTEAPRPCFEMDPIAWGAFPDAELDDNPTCDAAELAEAGDHEGAREILMAVLERDLRCIDAHAHLGNLAFDAPRRAILHYEVGIRIGELSLPPDFDGVLEWGVIYNRPFLRCLHGYAMCRWQLGELAEAREVCERILSLNPSDNQGIRSCLQDIRQGLSWEAANAGDARVLH